ncbi:hypothetical protein ACFFJI_08995 [Allobacillus sp. GCM10007491]|nr:hypothetical protein [Allobacillus saliphilus]
MISRKIVSASISSSIFAVLLGLIMPNPFGDNPSSITDYLYAFTLSTPIYLMYSFPVILTYGVLASIISDKLSQFFAKKMKDDQIETILSGILHVLFGLILLFYSLGASILFFVTDRILLSKNKEYKSLQAIKSFAFPFGVWLVFVGIVYIEHIVTK